MSRDDSEENLNDSYIIQHENEMFEDIKQEAYEYYKKYKHLNDYYYKSDNQFYRKLFDQWMKEFYEKMNNLEKTTSLNQTRSKNNLILAEEQESIKNVQNLIPTKVKAKKTEILNKKLETSYDRLSEKKSKLLFSHNGFDMDDFIQIELPNEYNEDKHEGLINSLGEDLMESLKRYKSEKKTQNLMTNDDFMILLALLRKRKETKLEKIPYYVNYTTKLDRVYVNEKDEQLGTAIKEADVYVDINKFIKNYIEYD
jgi:hypothetical protein